MQKNIDAIFLGDSLTFGYGVPKDSCWVTKIINYFNFNALNKGINGDTTASMLSRFHNDVIKYNPKIVFIMGGSNDLLLNRPVSYIIENIELMITDSLSQKFNVIIGLPPFIVSKMAYGLFSPFSDYELVENNLIILREQLINLCLKYNIKYIDFYSLTSGKTELYLDGIHLNKEGNQALFNTALSLFKK